MADVEAGSIESIGGARPPVRPSPMARRFPDSISLRRRALFLAAAAAAGPWPAVLAQGNRGSMAQVLQARLPASPSYALTFDVRTEGEIWAVNRVVFGALRSTAPIDAITLIDPLQRRVWRRTLAELGWTARDQAQRPDLGDAIVLPEIRNAAAGRWTLLLERSPQRARAGRLQLAWQVLPRYELLMNASAPEVAAGETLLVTLRALDYGVPLQGLKSVELTWVDSSGATIGHAPALEGLRSPEGIAVSNEPGTYIARLALQQPGAYRVQADHAFGEAPNQTLRRAWLEVRVGQRGAALRLASVEVDTAAGTNGAGRCARGLRFRFDAEVTEPGNYVCTLLLRPGEPAGPRASGSALLSAGHGSVEVAVSAAKWIAAGQPVRLARVTLLRVDAAEAKLLADIEDLSLDGHPIDASAFCR